MNSSEVPELSTAKWAKFDGTLNAPTSLGVYVMRVASPNAICRLKGKSDIVYIGQGNLPARAKAHRVLRSDFKGKGWPLQLIARDGSVGGLEIGFFTCKNSKQRENELLFQYLTEHLELPPANNVLGALTPSQKTELVLMYADPASTPAKRKAAISEFLPPDHMIRGAS